MRVRMGIIALRVVTGLAVGLTLAACSDDDAGSGSSSEADPGASSAADPGSSESGTGRLDCPAYADIAVRIVDTQSQLYAPNRDQDPTEAIDDLVAELETLKADAPRPVQQAVTNLSAGFRSAAELLADPGGTNQTELLALATSLSKDSGRITAYIAKQCEESAPAS